MENKELDQQRVISQNIDFYKIFKVFLSRWYWILGCIVVALILAQVKVLYTVPIYQTGASLKLQDDNPILTGPSQMNAQASYTDKIVAEGYVIHSNDVIINAIGNLDYQVSYYLKGRIRTTEQYPNVPFKVEILEQDSVNFSRTEYSVEYINTEKFGIKDKEDPKAAMKVHRYGDVLNMGNMLFKITSRIPNIGDYSFKFNSKSDFIGRISSNLSTGEAARFTNIMNLSQTDENYIFAADILNELMKEYIKYDVAQKKKSALQIVQFIDKQLGFISKQVDTSGSSLADYKTQNKMIDVGSATNLTIGKLTDFENRKNLLQIEMLGVNQLEEQLSREGNKVELNLNLEGVLSPMQGSLIAELNKLIGLRDLKLIDFNPESPVVKDIDSQIASVKLAIKKNINALKERNLATLNFINNQISELNHAISQLPDKEQKFVKLTTNFEVNNKVRTYLSEKKLEAETNAAATVPGATIVNKAFPNDVSIAVNPSSTYTYAVLLGLGCGIGLILLVRFLNPYIYDKETVESLTRTPIIGVIRKFPEYIDKNSRQALSLSKPKSVFAESVRSVRTNLSFLASHKKSKTICITSEISGEGKSFVTVNLAGTLALIDKRVILVAADLRKSKLHKAFGSNNKIGLSSYLSGQETLESVIIHDDVHNIDFIPSGPVPPNPSELLHTEKMKELLDILAPKYDYVLVDTAPVGLVSDAIPLIRQSDVNLFVIRSGKSQFRAAAIPERLSREYGLSNLAIVLNAFGDDALHANYYTTDYSRGGGNSTYYYSDYSGYAGSGYYDNDPKRWWEFWKKK
ncbi:MAG: polysaccharide biosynthesis tyrosine autokinase [Bacteroidota bacterium]